MEIPSVGIVNRYIATQGPLPHTCAHFWQVVWDHKLSLIIMLTTLTERGRVSVFRFLYSEEILHLETVLPIVVIKEP